MTVNGKILKRIQGKGRGNVFTPKDFLDLGSRAAVDQTLSRLTKQGAIRRLNRGLYDYPKTSKRLGALSPAPFDVACAVARQTDSKIQISGARAANALGLTDQVPAQVVYLTDGPPRQIRVGSQRIVMKHRSKRNLPGLGHRSGAVFQALTYLGKDNISNGIIKKLQDDLPVQLKARLQRDAIHAPSWTQDVVRQIVAT